jgi:hypothetical protein
MLPIHDRFVGGAAILIGCLLVAGAIANSQTLMQLSKSRLLAESLGKTRARLVIAAIGVVCIVMGGLIAAGWRFRW